MTGELQSDISHMSRQGNSLSGIVIRRTDVHEALRTPRFRGMTSMSVVRHHGRATTYDVMRAGLNYRMDEIRAALGLVQMRKLDRKRTACETLTEQYQRMLGGSARNESFLRPEPAARPSYHIFPVLLPPQTDRDRVVVSMHKAGIQTSIHYPAYKSFTRYKTGLRGGVPVASEIAERVLTRPLDLSMSTDQVEDVVAAFPSAPAGAR